MPKIGILSLGCARNLVDSEVILGRLKNKGYQIVNLDKADVVLVNTCAFIQEAKEESIQVILDLIELKKLGSLKKIIVAGCLSQRYKHKLVKELPEIDAFLGTMSLNHTRQRFPISPSHYTYVKICEGCINNCSFCVIPKLKPHFRSLAVDSILQEIEDLDTGSCREINIIGQDITAYGWDLYREFRLTHLLKSILKSLKNKKWIRLLYLSPERVSKELLQLIADNPAIVKYIDLPIQHINNRILKSMKRGIDKSKILKLIERIRKMIPEAAIRTSLIVGFPGETDKEFKELLDFIKEVKFERLGVFIYSREENTAAFDFKHQLPQEVKEARFDLIMSSQQEIAYAVNKRYQAKKLEVLIDEKREDGLYVGRSQFDAPEVDGLVYVKSKKDIAIGSFVNVKIIDTLEYDLVGELQ